MPRISSRARVVALLVAGLSVCSPSTTLARKQRELPYGFAQVWSTALRLVRVDLKLPVTDRDAEGGFVLFEYLANDRAHPGSIELIAQGASARSSTMAIVQVAGQPSYVEQMILDRLEKKLRAELGPPLGADKPAKPPPSRPDEPDAGGVSDAGTSP